MNEVYKKQVGLLIKIIPLIYKIKEFAIHGGTAINLFVKDMPRYSVDIDLTFLPIAERDESIVQINQRLLELKDRVEKSVPGIKTIHKPAAWKLLCTKDGSTVKIEVNGTKRGIIGQIEERELCLKAQNEFSMSCRAKIVSISQLYGGKIAAALSRQHPRDLFDYKYMVINSFEDIKEGLMLCLLGSDKPIVELLCPNAVDQSAAMRNQFNGMTDISFEYSDFEQTRADLIETVNENLSATDKEFLISFEQGSPDWSKCCAGDLSNFPSVKWKMQNIQQLKATNITKFNQGVRKLSEHLNKTNVE